MSFNASAERYVAGRMSEEEEQQFEERMLEQPELAAEVDARFRMKAGLQRLEERGELHGLVASARHPLRYRGWVAAASVLAVLVVGVVLWTSPRAPIMSSVNGAPIAGTYLLGTTRTGNAGVPTIEVAPGDGVVRLNVIPQVDAASYTARLLPVSDEPVELKAVNGTVQLFLDPRAFDSDYYELRLVLAPQVAGAEEEQFPFILKLQPKL